MSDLDIEQGWLKDSFTGTGTGTCTGFNLVIVSVLILINLLIPLKVEFTVI